MTILKNLMLSLTIVPLTVSMAFAANGGGAGKATFKEFTMKEQVVTPILSKESRVIKQQTIKPLAQVNPTKAPVKEKHLYHNEKKSECYRRYGNPPTITIGGKTLSVACEVEEIGMEMHPSVMLDSNIVNPTPSDPEYSKE